MVLLGEDRRPIGVELKSRVHHRETPLHLAFSVYLFDGPLDGEPRFLATRRAVTKATWPGVWTNTCCGHPGPGEDLVEAIRRRVRQELAVDVLDLECVLPDFRYRAIDAGGTVENEVCPVFVGQVDADPEPEPDPAEVEQWRWVPWRQLVGLARDVPWTLSPWATEQIPLLDDLLARRRTHDPAGDLPRFAARVLEVVDRVPAGQVLTYGDVAEYLGDGGARGVGQVMSRHGSRVPWWRILRAGGLPPPGKEAAALAHYREEGTALSGDGTRVDLTRARWQGDETG